MIIQQGEQVCQGDRERSHSPQVQCAGCHETVLDQHYLNALEKSWHLTCFRCSQCQQVLEAPTSVFSRNEQIFCRDDYYKLFAKQQCAACQTIISPEELVMKAKAFTYHTNCFKCTVCGFILNPGDQFGLRDTSIYCRRHFEQVEMREEAFPQPPQQPQPQIPVQSTLPTPTYPGSQDFGILNILGANVDEEEPKKARKQKRSSPYETISYSPYQIPSDESKESNSPGGHKTTKRVRTSFKNYQTEQMRAFFEYNQNPDTNELKELSEKTGLDKRILQVWFQNARAKLRRLGHSGGQKKRTKKSSQDSFDNQQEEAMMAPVGYIDDPSGMYPMMYNPTNVEM